jgi:lambda family phage portal protein
VAAHSAFVVGKGARFQSLAVDSKGAPDKELRKRIENGFKNWMEKASTDGRLHFYECQRLALRQRLETGEYFVCFRSPEAKGRHPLALQFIEPDRISGSYEVKPTKADSIVWQGIEFSAETGERFGYHVKKACWPTRFEYGWEVVPEERMLHGFQVLRPGQLRGVTCFAPAIILADSMNDMMISELDAAKMTAKFMGFITTPDPVDFRASRISPKGAADKEDKRLEDLENCAIEYLKPGEKIEFPSSPSRAGDSFDRFTKFVLRMTSIAVGPPFEILSGDYSGINYSTSRMSRQDYNLILEPERFWLEQEFNRPIFKYWLKLESLKNPSDYRGYDKDPLRFELASWIPAGMPSPDPLREGKAVIDMIKMGLMSPQEAILKEGGDPEQVLEELAEFQRLKKEKGVQTYEDSISLALVQNPAKLEQEDV